MAIPFSPGYIGRSVYVNPFVSDTAFKYGCDPTLRHIKYNSISGIILSANSNVFGGYYTVKFHEDEISHIALLEGDVLDFKIGSRAVGSGANITHSYTSTRITDRTSGQIKMMRRQRMSDASCKDRCSLLGRAFYKLFNRKDPVRMDSGLGVKAKIVNFAKNLTLSADEKLLREMGLVTECGDYTKEAEQIVMAKLCADNKEYLVDIAKRAKEDEKSKK